MKKVLFFFCSVLSCHAVTVTHSSINILDPDGNIATDNTFAVIGSFSGSVSPNFTAQQLSDNFTVLNSMRGNSVTSGSYSINESFNSNGFTTQSIDLLIFKGTIRGSLALEDATQALIYRLDTTYSDISANFSTYSIDFGSNTNAAGSVLFGQNSNQMSNFGVVPEPSSALLLGLACASSMFLRHRV